MAECILSADCDNAKSALLQTLPSPVGEQAKVPRKARHLGRRQMYLGLRKGTQTPTPLSENSEHVF